MALVGNAAMVVAALYVLTLCVLALFQRRLLYFPGGPLLTPAQAGVEKIETLHLATQDGETLLAWFARPQPGRPLILYFHGNGGALADRALRFREMLASGYGLLAIAYRGYPGSTGRPTQEGLLLDGEAAFAEAERRGFTDGRLVVMGESLGTGVATILAARHKAAALVLDSPFLSVLHVAQTRYRFFPIGWLMRDPYRSDLAIGAVDMPLLVAHGESDPIIPIAEARGLFALAKEPKRFIAVPRAGHLVLGRPEVYEQVEAFIDGR
ncbi:MAG TPA: alpha/beta fold hydrolase [Methylocystis sp.]|nr:alpha/beta fold hydrolase [Methylocystis sp.]